MKGLNDPTCVAFMASSMETSATNGSQVSERSEGWWVGEWVDECVCVGWGGAERSGAELSGVNREEAAAGGEEKAAPGTQAAKVSTRHRMRGETGQCASPPHNHQKSHMHGLTDRKPH